MAKEVISFEGCKLVVDRALPIRKGDTYLAERNTGPKLLTCSWHNEETSVVFPVEMAYAFDTHECIRVLSIDGEEV